VWPEVDEWQLRSMARSPRSGRCPALRWLSPADLRALIAQWFTTPPVSGLSMVYLSPRTLMGGGLHQRPRGGLGRRGIVWIHEDDEYRRLHPSMSDGGDVV